MQKAVSYLAAALAGAVVVIILIVAVSGGSLPSAEAGPIVDTNTPRPTRTPEGQTPAPVTPTPSVPTPSPSPSPTPAPEILTANVTWAGTLISGRGATYAQAVSQTYIVGFDRDVLTCTGIAGVADTGGNHAGVQPFTTMVVTESASAPDNVYVTAGNAAVAADFSVILVC